MAPNRSSKVEVPGRTSPAQVSPVPAKAVPDSRPLLALLSLESQVRSCENENELVYLIANETRKLSRARQVFVMDNRPRRPKVVGISSLDAVDRNVPLVRWIEKLIANLKRQDGDGTAREFMLPAYCPKDAADTKRYPFPHMLWIPFLTKSELVIGGILLVREQPWGEADIVVAKRLADAYTFGLIFQRTGSPRRAVKARGRWWAYMLAAAIIGAQFIPVPLVVHAPVEVTPKNPFVITAPIDGVIGAVIVEPNSAVEAGDVVMRFEDTKLRNDLVLAEEELHVAQTRLKRVSQGAFTDPDAKKELRIAIAERDLKQKQRDYTDQLLSRATVRAPRDGTAVFADRNEWNGKPVRTGERIMSIADPQKYEFTIELPVADSIVLDDKARVRLFLNSDPLKAVETTLQSVAYEARMSDANILSYRLTADQQETDDRNWRLGSRGTAQIFGSDVPLFYFLFRRPLSSLRNLLTL
ncbi:MAG: HlyD family efflux transporter periplasmic adaptor subunit [Hyphomicrobiales bacterium]|nr:HlyD family efflux transporter periplasmic adaptor subunit [Hyphomicrobiales bacterium]